MVSPHPTPLLVDVGTAIGEAGGVIQYGLVFLFAALPWVEILVVIPIAIGVGLNPVLTGIVAFAGNAGSVYVLLLFHRRIARWRRRRRSKPEDGDEPTGRRHEWAHGVWDRYGLPGLSLAAPVLTGVHLAALLALAAGSRTRSVGGWMTLGIAAWTVALVVGSAFGTSLLGTLD
ncbi:small multi-drug export protein [Halorubrum sp. JWXQ-INN 858]|uniref:small multi-drug export protein n=1 Tax=Halorubrum sp. JWXQ-INN 858 TaxID=2690782 RepID=UPI001357380D|nr:small multi-drug export protein [Halorubrum sp. JWXQ-INN 858]MWV65524.1 small multi-drug export protein [Halorubrum sp. JWXQ-INN 858]